MAKGIKCNGDDCAERVMPDDDYYASPCGTYCNECMDDHAQECDTCRKEFDIELRVPPFCCPKCGESESFVMQQSTAEEQQFFGFDDDGAPDSDTWGNTESFGEAQTEDSLPTTGLGTYKCKECDYEFDEPTRGVVKDADALYQAGIAKYQRNQRIAQNSAKMVAFIEAIAADNIEYTDLVGQAEALLDVIEGREVASVGQ